MRFSVSIAQGHRNAPAVTSTRDRYRSIRRGCAVLSAFSVHGQAAQGSRESIIDGDGVACLSSHENVLPSFVCRPDVKAGLLLLGIGKILLGVQHCRFRRFLGFLGGFLCCFCRSIGGGGVTGGANFTLRPLGAGVALLAPEISGGDSVRQLL